MLRFEIAPFVLSSPSFISPSNTIVFTDTASVFLSLECMMVCYASILHTLSCSQESSLTMAFCRLEAAHIGLP